MARPKGHPDGSLISSLANEIKWAGVDDRTAATQPARDAMRDKFLREAREKFTSVIDPDGEMPEDELEKELAYRAEHLRRAHFKRMALKSAQARRAKRASRKEAA